MYDPRGSLWSKWDLHIHTPESIVENFPGSGDAAWSAYIDDLEALPPEFKVLGINDYWFVDGYERLLAEQRNGRLANIELLLPVVELRLNVFGGTESSLSRVNLHVIFSEDLGPEVIRDQFVRALAGSFHLVPRHESLTTSWSGVVTKDALQDLGQAIIDSVPEAERGHYGLPLFEGFKNLTISLERVLGILQRPYFAGKALVGVGKTEWADVKWKDGAIADKKNVINACDLVFTAAASPGAYHRSRKALQKGGVNDRLLDCSDAHNPSDSNDKDRVGNSHTWIKGAYTFGGLRQALAEFEHRVFVGNEPAELARVREHPSRYIDRLAIGPVQPGAFPEAWFDVDIPIHSGLVAVIGNRGSGKSALAESVALAGGTEHEDDFSFLRRTKFREPRRNPARHFVATLRWRDGEDSRSILSDSPDPGTTPLVQHLPQQFLEKLCNEVPKGAKTDFDLELERIIFAHLPTEDRMGAESLSDRVALGNRAREEGIDELRAQLSARNQRIVEIEHRLAPAQQLRAIQEYGAKRKEWFELKRSPPEPVAKPKAEDAEQDDLQAMAEAYGIAAAHLEGLRDAAQEDLAATRRKAAELSGFRSTLERLQREHSQLLEDHSELLEDLGLEAVSSFEIRTDRLDQAQAALATKEETGASELDDQNNRSLPNAIEEARSEAAKIREAMTAPTERYQQYVDELARWDADVAELRGSPDGGEGLLAARARLQELRQLPAELTTEREARSKLTAQIHELLLEEAASYGELYGPLENHMNDQPVLPEYRLTVDTSLVDTGFAEGFLEDRIHRHTAGSFCGKEESLQVVGGLLDEVDPNDTGSVLNFVGAIHERLHADFRHPERPAAAPGDQIKKGRTLEEVYDYLFGLSYLSPRYGLRFGKKPIHLLSPGEKGVLLLIFFLLAETNTRPLVIDQPEDNLDNQTVYKALVQCFHRARKRRQVIVITHNPNLAVVCDADQVIVASMDKERENRVEYFSGPIEQPEVNQAILDILEGTRPAFQNRSRKYDLHTSEEAPKQAAT